MKQSPLPARRSYITRTKGVPRVNATRKARTFARTYGSKARVEFVKALPSVWDGAGPCVNAHVGPEGKGASRKANADQIVPLTDAQHKAFDEYRFPFDDERARAAVRACCADVERAWRLSATVFEQVAGLDFELLADDGEGVGVDPARLVGLHEVVAGGHGEARQLGEAVGGEPLGLEEGGEAPADRHGGKVTPKLRLDNSTVWPYYSGVTLQELSMARFIDAPTADRCTATVTLRDKTTADCGRRATVGDRCWQHAPKAASLPTWPCGRRECVAHATGRDCREG